MFKKLKFFWQVFQQVRHVQRGDVSDRTAARQIMRETAIAKGDDPDDLFPHPTVALSDGAMEKLLEPEFAAIYPDDFKLTSQHIALIRKMRLSWNTVETGAPCQDVRRPFAGTQTLSLLDDVLTNGRDEESKVNFLILRRAALSAFCEQATLAPGRYSIHNIAHSDVEAALDWLDDWQEKIGVNTDMQIDLTADDIALAKNASWEWPAEEEMEEAFEHGEVAGPTVDPKRPYGEMSYIDLDMHRILEWPGCRAQR